MGRSVSTPSRAAEVVYASFQGEEQYEWNEQIDYLKEALQEAFPSLYEDEKWVGREDRAILANRLLRVGVSEYCGLVSVWLLPKDENFSEAFCAQIAPKFNKVVSQCFGGSLQRIGTASNGESFFRRVA